MATLTLGKSVTIDQVASKKGDAVFVERRRRVVAPGSKELREEPVKPDAPRNAADEKLRAVLAAARAREEERKNVSPKKKRSVLHARRKLRVKIANMNMSKNSWRPVILLCRLISQMWMKSRHPRKSVNMLPRLRRVVNLTAKTKIIVRPNLQIQRKNLKNLGKYRCMIL